MNRLVLASSSPRRRDLLQAHGYSFDVRSPAVVERRLPGEGARDFAVRMAREKAGSVLASPDEIVLAADTVVHLGSITLGKPRDPVDAARMLTGLSGGWHQVTTGFCVRASAREESGALTTQVRFRAMTAQALWGYVASGEPLDKAGAYGIQGLGAGLVAEINGSYTNVVGLPLAEVVKVLAELGVADPMEGVA